MRTTARTEFKTWQPLPDLAESEKTGPPPVNARPERDERRGGAKKTKAVRSLPVAAEGGHPGEPENGPTGPANLPQP